MRGVRWVQGVLFGFVVGAAALEFPALGLLLLVACLVWAVIDGTRPAGMAGLWLGLGTAIAALLLAANARCGEFNSQPNQGCTPPDITPYLVVAGVLIAVGAVLSLVTLRRQRREPSGRDQIATG